ncbi:MAG: DUF2017 domain-containing protein [Cryobacterium sp.]|nr:DUF2017 domain-containing protein [Cryobacterium sp.]
MKAFIREHDGAISAELDRDEALLLQSLASQVSVLLREGNANDPAVIRMLPDAYPGDPASSAEFRRYTASGLIDRKVANADAVIVSLSAAIETGVVRLGSTEATAWLRSLTDIRLSLASRLGIEADDQGPSEDSVLQNLYDWLGFLQNSLVEAVDDRVAPADGDND